MREVIERNERIQEEHWRFKCRRSVRQMMIKEQLALEFTKVGITTNMDIGADVFEANQIGHLVLTFPDGVVFTLMPELDFPDEPNMPILKIVKGEV